MYTAIPTQPTNARAWLAAAAAVQDAGGEANNVVIDIADAVAVSETDDAILTTVDQFLRQHHVNTLAGVANTIFPQGLLDRHGADGLYTAYNGVVLPRMKQMTHDWGRYFERMTTWKKVKGKEVVIINPLDDLVRFMRDQIASDRTYRNAFEMTIYDPTRDAGKVSNRQCLSFLSFKLTHEKVLSLTVMYRNHAYVARGLGNFLGLGRLLRIRRRSIRSQARLAHLHLNACRDRRQQEDAKWRCARLDNWGGERADQEVSRIHPVASRLPTYDWSGHRSKRISR